MTERLINYKKLFSFKHLMAVALFVNHRRFYSTSEYAVQNTHSDTATIPNCTSPCSVVHVKGKMLENALCHNVSRDLIKFLDMNLDQFQTLLSHSLAHRLTVCKISSNSNKQAGPKTQPRDDNVTLQHLQIICQVN